MDMRRTVFAQLMDCVPRYQFQLCAQRYRGDYKIKDFSCWKQWLCMVFAQLTYRESLRDIEATLGSVAGRLYHMGIRGRVARSSLAHTNEKEPRQSIQEARPWEEKELEVLVWTLQPGEAEIVGERIAQLLT